MSIGKGNGNTNINALVEVQSITADAKFRVLEANSSQYNSIKRENIGLQPESDVLTALEGLAYAADRISYSTGATTFSITTLTSYGRSIIAVASESAFKQLVNLEIGVDVAAFSHTHAADAVVSGTFADARIAASNVTQHQSALSIAYSQLTGVPLGTAEGIATLDSGGKVPVGQLPNSIMEYQGTWNATTNTPTLADGTAANAGNVYRVSVGGTINLGSGNITFDVGDYAACNHLGVWEKSDTTDSVPSVFGRTGNVTAAAADYTSFYVRHDTAAQGLDGTAQSNARTNLGLGTLSTQAANNVSITGGAISGATGAFTTLSATGTRTFGANGRTIVLDKTVTLTDATATTIATITLPTANNRAGFYTAKIEGIIHNGDSSSDTVVGGKRIEATASFGQDGGAISSVGPITTISIGTSFGDSLGGRDIATATINVALSGTDNSTHEIQLNVDGSGSSSVKLQFIGTITIHYNVFRTFTAS